MSSYYAPPPNPRYGPDRSYSPLTYLLALMPLLLIGVAIGVLVHVSGLSLPLIGGNSGPSVESVANSPEGTLLYPGATNVKHETAQGDVPDQSNVLKQLLGNLGQSDKLTAATTVFNAPTSAIAVSGWYSSFLTTHGWRACGANTTAMGISGQIYTRNTNEAYMIFAMDAGAFAGLLTSTQVNTGQTVGITFYAVSSGDLHLSNC